MPSRRLDTSRWRNSQQSTPRRGRRPSDGPTDRPRLGIWGRELLVHLFNKQKPELDRILTSPLLDTRRKPMQASVPKRLRRRPTTPVHHHHVRAFRRLILASTRPYVHSITDMQARDDESRPRLSPKMPSVLPVRTQSPDSDQWPLPLVFVSVLLRKFVLPRLCSLQPCYASAKAAREGGIARHCQYIPPTARSVGYSSAGLEQVSASFFICVFREDHPPRGKAARLSRCALHRAAAVPAPGCMHM